MDWLTFIAGLVKDGAWPLAISVVTYLVTNRGREIARHIDGVTLPKGVAIRFRDAADEQTRFEQSKRRTAQRRRKLRGQRPPDNK